MGIQHRNRQDDLAVSKDSALFSRKDLGPLVQAPIGLKNKEERHQNCHPQGK